MKKASKKAYVSKNVLEVYQREREKLLQKKEEQKLGAGEAIQEVDEDYQSAEEVDSDDLGDDIDKPKQSVQIQPQQIVQQQISSRVAAPQQQMLAGPQPQQQQSSKHILFGGGAAIQPPKLKSQKTLPAQPTPGEILRAKAAPMKKKMAPPQPPMMQKMHQSMSQLGVQPQQQQPIQPQQLQTLGLMSSSPPSAIPLLKPPPQPPKAVYKQKVDTNVFQISMDCLKDTTAELATGDPIHCKGCQAIFNVYSTLVQQADASQLWVCEFCNEKNLVNIEPEERPKSEAVSYMLESAPIVVAPTGGVVAPTGGAGEMTTASKPQVAKDISVVFCMDISGSMGLTSHKLARISAMKQPTRLEVVQQTLEGQIKEMREKHPERKVGLVAFDDVVDIIGDGSNEVTQLTQDNYNDFHFVVKNGVACAGSHFNLPIKHSADKLTQYVQAMRPRRNTALGPALLTSIALAGEGSLGSQVIVCTDGLSNAGPGSSKSGGQETIAKFYEQCGEYAKSKGVTVHIVTIIGAECNIDAISPVAEATNGEIERVNPSDIQRNFGDFLAKQVLATRVQLKVKLHKGLEFRGENPAHMSADRSILNKDFGNVNADTDLTFEYQLKPVSQLLRLSDIDFTQLRHLPFQAQIHYTALDGSRQVRVITQRLETSSDKEGLRKEADFEVLGINAVQQSNKLARQGDFKKAQVAVKAWDRVMNKEAGALSVEQKVQVSNFRGAITESYQMMNSNAQIQERESKVMGKKAVVSDAASQQFYSQQRMNKSKFNKK
ncbi:hypothetical protein FGO68_gene1626 [Halteria grandinella]|uniref:VWFA domain-containing protein n=1 Tax=Halteria grandinella TaxID=5974 RepID=A0A8J8NW86_HALGN|nr:hypothetical protein FGO68_gene1626 [Halteria grandinella]